MPHTLLVYKIVVFNSCNKKLSCISKALSYPYVCL